MKIYMQVILVYVIILRSFKKELRNLNKIQTNYEDLRIGAKKTKFVESSMRYVKILFCHEFNRSSTCLNLCVHDVSI